jgi:hypothetical protein
MKCEPFEQDHTGGEFVQGFIPHRQASVARIPLRSIAREYRQDNRVKEQRARFRVVASALKRGPRPCLEAEIGRVRTTSGAPEFLAYVIRRGFEPRRSDHPAPSPRAQQVCQITCVVQLIQPHDKSAQTRRRLD